MSDFYFQKERVEMGLKYFYFLFQALMDVFDEPLRGIGGVLDG